MNMKKPLILWPIASAAVMLLLPWFVSALTGSGAGMAVSLLLLFAIDPLYSLVVGFFAGKEMKQLWSLPVLSALLFLPGALFFLGMDANAAFLYAAVYLVCGAVAMLLSRMLQKKKR